MNRKRITALCLGALSIVFSSIVLASESPTRSEFEELQTRVERLESLLGSLQIEIDRETVSSPVSKTETDVSSDTTILDSVINLIHSREESTNYPWMSSDLWSSLKSGMTVEEVSDILGRPTLDEPSLSKRIDTVYTYKGKQASTGNKLKGIVRFYRNKLTEIEPPEIY